MQQSPSNFMDNEGRKSTIKINAGKKRLSQCKSCNSNPSQKAGKNLCIRDFPDKILLAFHPEIFQFKNHLIPKVFIKTHSLYISACTRCDVSL